MFILRAMTTRVLAAMLATAALAVLAPPLRAQPSALVRVGLLPSVESATVGADGPFEVVEVESGRRDTLEGGRLSLRPSAQGIELAGTAYGATIRLLPRAAFLQVNGRSYRGNVEVRRTPQGRITVINELDLEEYLYGVVRSEMDPRWPPEALRAQAIAARSLALYWSGRYGAEGYDVRATTDSQVYGGIAAEEPRATAAVDATRGMVLLYDGRPVFAAYHTDSGGATESSEFVWGSLTPYLRGVPDPYSQDAANHTWTLRLELSTIESRLQRSGRPVAGLQRVEVAATSPSGRAMTVRLLTTAGAPEMRGTEFRTAIGSGVLRSTLFAVRALPDGAAEFSGRGFGHGVGMSQWGARGQALAGRGYGEILRYYYTGVAIVSRP